MVCARGHLRGHLLLRRKAMEYGHVAMRTSMSCAISRLCCFTFALSFCCTMRSRDMDSLSCILSFAYPSLAFPGCCCLEACRQTVQLKRLEAPLCIYVCSCGAWRRRRSCLWWGVRGVMAAVHIRKVKLQVGLGAGCRRRRGMLGRGDTRPRFQRLGPPSPLHVTNLVQRLSPSSLNFQSGIPMTRTRISS